MNPIAVSLAWLALGQPAQPALEMPSFHLTTTDPNTAIGPLTKLEADLSLTLGREAVQVKAGELISLRRIDLPRPAWPRGPQILLANGDRLPGSVLGGDGLSLQFGFQLTPSKKEGIALPLSAVATIWFVPPTSDALSPSWQDRTRKQDALLLRNGDLVRGTFEGLGEAGKSLRFKTTGEAAGKPYDRDLVAAVALDPSLSRVRLPKGPYPKIVLANGSRVALKSATSDGKTLTAQTLTGGKFTVNLTEVVALDVLQGKATYLSELKPKQVKEEGFNAVAWPWVADRSAKNNPLRLHTALGEQTYDRGLGLHSKTTLTYALNQKYRRFESEIGLDAATGQRGAVEVKILVDGRGEVIPGLEKLRATDRTIPVTVNVSKGKELTLIVDYGTGGDVQDDVNFAEARLVE